MIVTTEKRMLQFDLSTRKDILELNQHITIFMNSIRFGGQGT